MLVQIERYLEHIRLKATGGVMTTAAWIRQFVRSHPSYKYDSVVSDEVAYDLVVACRLVLHWKFSSPRQ
jgi:glutamate--cysteine ligase catalytic subunit